MATAAPRATSAERSGVKAAVHHPHHSHHSHQASPAPNAFARPRTAGSSTSSNGALEVDNGSRRRRERSDDASFSGQLVSHTARAELLATILDKLPESARERVDQAVQQARCQVGHLRAEQTQCELAKPRPHNRSPAKAAPWMNRKMEGLLTAGAALGVGGSSSSVRGAGAGAVIAAGTTSSSLRRTGAPVASSSKMAVARSAWA